MTDYSNKRFASSLRAERARLGINQGELSKLTGISQTTISRYETGSVVPDVRNVWTLSNLFGVSPSVLLGWEKAVPA